MSKLGRSSKPSPRFLVLVWYSSLRGSRSLSDRCPLLQTEKALYIAVTNAKDGQTFTTLERKINLVTIKSISMSNLRDDWLVGCLNEYDWRHADCALGPQPRSDRRRRPYHQLCLQDRVGDPHAQVDSRKHQRRHRADVSGPYSCFYCMPNYLPASTITRRKRRRRRSSSSKTKPFLEMTRTRAIPCMCLLANRPTANHILCRNARKGSFDPSRRANFYAKAVHQT